MLFQRPDGRGVRVGAMPRYRVKILDKQAKRAARDAALLEFSERGLTAADIIEVGGVAMTERGIQHAIARARKLREQWQGATDKNGDPVVEPMFGCQPWVREKEELPPIGGDCSHCRRAIEPGSSGYCPKCVLSGHEERMARELGIAVMRVPPPVPKAKSKLQGSSNSAEPANPPVQPRLTNAHRIELAKTPQGYRFLESIGQLPQIPASKSKKKKKASA